MFTPTGPSQPISAAREVQLRVRSKGRIVASAIAGLRNEGPPGTQAYVSVMLIVDGCVATSSDVAVDGGHTAQAPVQVFAHAAPGVHVIRVETAGSYSSYQPGDVLVSPVSLIASVLPAP